MAGRLYNLGVANLVHTYEAEGYFNFPGIEIGNERANVFLQPDNDAGDAGVDLGANLDNGRGPQLDGDNPGVYVDLDTGTGNGATPFVGGIDDSDGNYNGDAAVLGGSNQTPDQGLLGVHLSGTNDDTVSGPGQTVEGTVEGTPVGSQISDGSVAGYTILDFDNA